MDLTEGNVCLLGTLAPAPEAARSPPGPPYPSLSLRLRRAPVRTAPSVGFKEQVPPAVRLQ